MARNTRRPNITDESVMNKIYMIRGQKVMIDRDLVNLYQVETRVLNQAVRRNLSRFPKDFMFQLTPREFKNWKSQFVISNNEKMSLRKSPLAFTEQGVAMLSSVLNSEISIYVNIQIIRVFTRMRQMLLTHKDILLKLEQVERKLGDHGNEIVLIFKHLRELLHPPQLPRAQIGFRRKSEG